MFSILDVCGGGGGTMGAWGFSPAPQSYSKKRPDIQLGKSAVINTII